MSNTTTTAGLFDRPCGCSPNCEKVLQMTRPEILVLGNLGTIFPVHIGCISMLGNDFEQVEPARDRSYALFVKLSTAPLF